MSHAVVDYFAYGIHKVHEAIEDVHDPFVREIKKVMFVCNVVCFIISLKLIDAEDTKFVDVR